MDNQIAEGNEVTVNQSPNRPKDQVFQSDKKDDFNVASSLFTGNLLLRLVERKREAT